MKVYKSMKGARRKKMAAVDEAGLEQLEAAESAVGVDCLA